MAEAAAEGAGQGLSDAASKPDVNTRYNPSESEPVCFEAAGMTVVTTARTASMT